jgi:hypothetical protein
MKRYVAAIVKRHDFPTEWGQREKRTQSTSTIMAEKQIWPCKRRGGEKAYFL